MTFTVLWSHLGLGSVIAFLVGWLVFGLLGAVLLGLVVMFLMGTIRVK